MKNYVIRDATRETGEFRFAKQKLCASRFPSRPASAVGWQGGATRLAGPAGRRVRGACVFGSLLLDRRRRVGSFDLLAVDEHDDIVHVHLELVHNDRGQLIAARALYLDLFRLSRLAFFES